MIAATSVRRVLAKELREAGRDRNLILNVVLIPLFLYPLLGFGILQVLQIVSGVGERTQTVIALQGEVPAAVRDSLAAGSRVLLREAPKERELVTAESFRAWREEVRERDEPSPDVLLSWTPSAAGDSARIVYDGSRDRSSEARTRIEAAIEAYRRERSLAALQA
jgi:hypothetical protein